jgi:flagellar motor switch protein FliN/FliY
MSEEIDNNTPSEDTSPEPQPEDQASDAQPVDAQLDASEDLPSTEKEMTPEESETLAAAMAAINQVQGVADSVDPAPAAGGSDAQAFESPVFQGNDSASSKEGIDILSDVHMDVRIELGRTKMFVEDVLKLNDGAVVELDKLAGDPVDVFVNNRKVARGEVLVLNDLFCVRISEIVDISATEV